MALLKLDEAPVTDLDVFANPSDLRRDLHILVDYVRTHQIKRGHRDNRIPQAHRRRLAGLMSDPAAAAKPDKWGDFPWIEHVDWLSLALKFVRYDTEGTYAGYSSSEPCYPENYIEFAEEPYEEFLRLPPAAQEERILEIHLGHVSHGDNELFSHGCLSRLDPFDSWGCATGVVPTIPFPKVRRCLLELLAQCPSGVWFSTASLVEHLRLHDPWFLIPKDLPAKVAAETGRYGNFIERKRGDWGNRKPISSRDAEGFAKVEGRFIERFLEGLPLLLGYVDVAYVKQRKESAIEPSQGLLPAFRVTERLARAIRREIAAPKVTVLPNFEVHVESLFFPAATERRLRPLSDLVQRGIVTVFKLTKSKVAAELATNPEENPIEALKVLSGRELPANVEQELNDWAGHSEKFILFEGFGLLEGRREEAAAAEFVAETISPDFAIVRSAEKLYQHLEERERVPLRIRHSDKLLAVPESVQSHLAPSARPRGAPGKKSVNVKRSVRTTLWFADADAHAACCKILLDAKCALPTDRRALTITYPRNVEPLVKECLKKLGEEYSVAVEDIET